MDWRPLMDFYIVEGLEKGGDGVLTVVVSASDSYEAMRAVARQGWFKGLSDTWRVHSLSKSHGPVRFLLDFKGAKNG